MPFEQLTPRPFTSAAILTYAPITSGVYGISNAREWIYIAETENIQAALLEHLKDIYASVMSRQPAGFVFEISDRAHRFSRQDRLVLEYEPSCNRHSAQRQ